MEQVIHQDHPYCVPSMIDNIYLIHDFLVFSGSLGIETGLILSDQEKLFA